MPIPLAELPRHPTARLVALVPALDAPVLGTFREQPRHVLVTNAAGARDARALLLIARTLRARLQERLEQQAHLDPALARRLVRLLAVARRA